MIRDESDRHDVPPHSARDVIRDTMDIVRIKANNDTFGTAVIEGLITSGRLSFVGLVCGAMGRSLDK